MKCVVMKLIGRRGLLRILLRGLFKKMSLKLKSSGCEGAIQLKGWGQLSRRKPQHLQDSPDGQSLARMRLWQKPGRLQCREQG